MRFKSASNPESGEHVADVWAGDDWVVFDFSDKNKAKAYSDLTPEDARRLGEKLIAAAAEVEAKQPKIPGGFEKGEIVIVNPRCPTAAKVIGADRIGPRSAVKVAYVADEGGLKAGHTTSWFPESIKKVSW